MSYDDEADFEPEISDSMQCLIDEAEEDLDPYRYAFNNPMSFDALEELMGRAPTKEEQLHLLKLQKQLNIGNDDALWYLLIALQYHLTLYRDIPEHIEQTVRSIIPLALGQIREETDKQLRRLQEEGKYERESFADDLGSAFKEMSNRLNKNVVKLVSNEIAKARKQSHWAYVWGAVAGVVSIFWITTLTMAVLWPEMLGG